MSNRVHFTLRIEGMTCEGCARHVTHALKGVPGVQSAEVGDSAVGAPGNRRPYRGGLYGTMEQVVI